MTDAQEYDGEHPEQEEEPQGNMVTMHPVQGVPSIPLVSGDTSLVALAEAFAAKVTSVQGTDDLPATAQLIASVEHTDPPPGLCDRFFALTMHTAVDWPEPPPLNLGTMIDFARVPATVAVTIEFMMAYLECVRRALGAEHVYDVHGKKIYM
jgi:hypothetical protein